MSDEYNLDDVLPGQKKDKRKKILDKLIEMEESEPDFLNGEEEPSTVFLPSSMLKEPKKKKKKSSSYDPDEWFNDMMTTSSLKVNKRSREKNFYFDESGIISGKKKKKIKKKEKGELIDFNKEFEPELALYRNLLVDQNRFTSDLQHEYDSITSTKSSSRGITKQMTDLIENINGARTLSMQLVEKNVNAKKLIAELTMKQKKESGNGLDSENMSDFASTYLKQMLNDRQVLFNSNGENSVSDYSEDEMFDLISDNISGDDIFSRPEEADIYLKYENKNVEVYIIINDNDIENYEFEARGEDGEIIDEYPLPNHTKISVNRSTNIATDTYGKKYNIIWR